MNMKKAFLFLLLPILFLSMSCKEEVFFDYEAYLTIVNIGNMEMDAAVAGKWERVPAYSSVTWAVLLDHENEVVDVLAEAKPVGYNDYDSELIRLRGDRDVQTWLAGWDNVGFVGALQRKESRVLPGKQDLQSILTRFR